MHDELVGKWRAIKHRAGDFSPYVDVAAKHFQEYLLRDDGTATWTVAAPNGMHECELHWRLDDDMLTFTVHVDPDPEYGVEYPTTEDYSYRIMALGEDQLILDSRPSGGEAIFWFQRS
jgi:hypothetical protein